MKNLKKKKKILSTAIMFFASFCVLAGSVFAWWISNDTFTGSNLETGSASLEIELYLFEVDEENEENSKWIKDQTSKILVEDMIPGDSRFYAIKVKNTSTFTGIPNFTLQALTSGSTPTKSIKDYNFVPDDDEGAFVEANDGIMLSKMMVLDLTCDVESIEHTDLDIPTSRDVGTVVTAEDQTLAVENSIYERTEGITKDYKYSATDADDEPAKLAYQQYLFLILEFHFSGAAGNDYQNAKMTMDMIKIGIDQEPDSDII